MFAMAKQGSEAAIRLVEVVTGVSLLIGAAVTFCTRSVRRLEVELPDH
jgi:hypothetical protein